jgi:hypothetical protein
MGANLGRLIPDYGGLLEAFRERAQELELSRKGIDDIAGWADGYAGKLLAGAAAKRRKIIGPLALELMLGTLGLKLILVEDPEATARTLAMRGEPVQRNQQRFGNTCRSSEKIESIKSRAKLAAPRENKTPPVSRAHLRVVQSRRGGKYGRGAA